MFSELEAVIFNDNAESTPVLSQNQLYDFFVNVWSETWRELNINSNDFRDDFHRFDTKVAFVYKEKPIAFHGYSSFNLNLKSDREHSYFRKLNLPVADMLAEKGLKRIVTTEYMAVANDFRKISGRYVAEILGGFTTQYFNNYDCDAMITIARNNRGVNQMCKMFGAYCLKENANLHNVEVDIMVFDPKNIKPNPNSEVQGIVDRLIGKSIIKQIKNAA